MASQIFATPRPEQELVDPSPLIHSVHHFINNNLSSCNHYEMACQIELLHNPSSPLLSFNQVKHHIQWLLGVVPLEYNICRNSCVAFTGPYSNLVACPHCPEPHYVPGSTMKAQKCFSTIPISPVIQAFYSSHTYSKEMHYLEKKLAENYEIVTVTNGKLDVYDDTACSQELLDAWGNGCFKKTYIALQFSIDDAQLHCDKQSEAWVFI